MKRFDKLMDKESLSSDEAEAMRELAAEIQGFEAVRYPIPEPTAEAAAAFRAEEEGKSGTVAAIAAWLTEMSHDFERNAHDRLVAPPPPGFAEVWPKLIQSSLDQSAFLAVLAHQIKTREWP